MGKKVKLSKLTSGDVPYQELLTKVEGEVVTIEEDCLEVSLLNLDKNFAEIEFIRIGILLNMCFVGEDALYKVVVEVEQIKEVSKLILVQKGKVQRIQRRKSFRVQAQQSIDYCLAEDSDFQFKTTGLDGTPKIAELIDISSVGLKMKVEFCQELEVGEILELKLNLSFLNGGALKGKIVRIEEDSMIVGVEFLELPDKITQQLTRWIFKKEEEFFEKNKKDLTD
ncbi:c-di-GMP-binding flagellar brake protein YcgR [Halanaerobacter jeridensis]|uniref:C-di-GMP-binding flagellar brake protein YcgR n=1 Tax=Halanaerobacter jeridensis TaxID=706427 RepID=A0A939BQX7_9FIRM|nr:c-di-GMP-binding flagellar brake protein YcgR [Halanaerobacter jeridensis]